MNPQTHNPASSSGTSTSPAPQKKTRSREGCFQCRRKKRKCDVVHPRCGACTKIDSECTFPPQEWDPVEGKLVTVRQPNKKKRPASTSGSTSMISPEVSTSLTPSTALPQFELPYISTYPIDPSSSVPIDPTSSVPIDPSLVNNIPGNGMGHNTFNMFTDLMGMDIPWPFPDPSQSSDPFIPNVLFDLGLPLSTQHSPQPFRMDQNHVPFEMLFNVDKQPPMPSHLQDMGGDTGGRATVEEMRVFWAELLQFYANLGDNYYYSTSPSDRKKITATLISENLSDVHLAASAFLCAARRVLLFRHEGDQEKASEWGQRAMTFHKAAREMLHDESFPLCSRIGAGIDLRLGHILQDEPIGAQAFQEMSRSIVRQHLGPQPIWYLTDRIDNSTISFTTFITSDVLYSLLSPGRKTTFDVRVADLPPGADPGLRVHLGIPAGILSALAQIINLAAEPELLASEEGQARAKDIERGLSKWKPEIRSGMTSSCLTETVAMQAMWYEVAKQLMYSWLFHHGILSKSIRSSVTEFLRTAEMIPEFDHNEDEARLFVRASRAGAWFIASTNAILPQERVKCLKGLNSCGNEKAFRDNALAVQVLWTEMDRMGRPPDDWRVFLEEKKMQVVFL